MSHIPDRDQAFTESISKNMQVPDRLSVSPAPRWRGDDLGSVKAPDEFLPAFTMQVPEKLTYSETGDMNPRPQFSPARQTVYSPSSLDLSWESFSGDVSNKDVPQSPIKRSYSDQCFSRTPPGTPTYMKPMFLRHPATFPSPDPTHQRSTSSHSKQPPPGHVPVPPPAAPSTLLTSMSLLQAARQLSLQITQRLLQSVDKYRAMETWSTEEDGGSAVELIVLRRQVIKISRRLAALERNNFERRNTEVLLFSLLFSACLLNVWLWVRR